MVFHPAGLESGVLAVVAENQKSLTLGIVHHILGQHVDVGHIRSSNGPRRFAIAAPDAPSVGAARQAARQDTRIISFLKGRHTFNRQACRTAMQAATALRRMSGAAVPAKVKGCSARVVFQVFVVAVTYQPVKQDNAAPSRDSSKGSQ